jgi:hypothetical protein
MNRKFLLFILLLVVLVFLFLIFQAKGPKLSESGSSSAMPNSSIDFGKAVTVDGWLLCLPSTTTEAGCVIGLHIQNSQSQNYGLINPNNLSLDYGLINPMGNKLDPTQITTGSHYRAVGTLVATPDFLKNYSLTGVIQLSQ